MSETAEQMVNERRAISFARLLRWGKGSVVFCVPPQIRSELGIVVGDVLGFRVRVIQGRRFLIGERIPLHNLARLPEVPVDVLKKVGG